MATRKSRARNLALGLSLGAATLAGCNSILDTDPPSEDGLGGAGGSHVGPGGADSGGAPGASGGRDSTGGVTHTSGGNTSESGGADGGLGGSGPSAAVGTLGETCSENGALACSGFAMKGQLSCEDGEWKSNGTCSGSNNCDTSEGAAGSCQPIAADCEGGEAGDATLECADGVPQVCGVDLTALADGEACESDQACVDGECLPVISECLGKSEGETVCSEDASETFDCGPNLVTKENQTACAAGTTCHGAACVRASCTVGFRVARSP